MTNWIRIDKRLPAKNACIIIYNPQLEKDIDFPGHSCTVSNTEYVRCGNALKEGFTHWAEFLPPPKSKLKRRMKCPKC